MSKPFVSKGAIIFFYKFFLVYLLKNKCLPINVCACVFLTKFNISVQIIYAFTMKLTDYELKNSHMKSNLLVN